MDEERTKAVLDILLDPTISLDVKMGTIAKEMKVPDRTVKESPTEEVEKESHVNPEWEPGRRYLVTAKRSVMVAPIEVLVLEVSSTGAYVKLRFENQAVSWLRAADAYTIIEQLPRIPGSF